MWFLLGNEMVKGVGEAQWALFCFFFSHSLFVFLFVFRVYSMAAGVVGALSSNFFSQQYNTCITINIV